MGAPLLLYNGQCAGNLAGVKPNKGIVMNTRPTVEVTLELVEEAIGYFDGEFDFSEEEKELEKSKLLANLLLDDSVFRFEKLNAEGIQQGEFNSSSPSIHSRFPLICTAIGLIIGNKILMQSTETPEAKSFTNQFDNLFGTMSVNEAILTEFGHNGSVKEIQRMGLARGESATTARIRLLETLKNIELSIQVARENLTYGHFVLQTAHALNKELWDENETLDTEYTRLKNQHPMFLLTELVTIFHYHLSKQGII